MDSKPESFPLKVLLWVSQILFSRSQFSSGSVLPLHAALVHTCPRETCNFAPLLLKIQLQLKYSSCSIQPPPGRIEVQIPFFNWSKKLIYNIVLLSGIQQSTAGVQVQGIQQRDSVTYLYYTHTQSYIYVYTCYCSVAKSRPTLPPHGLHHSRLYYLSPYLRV